MKINLCLVLILAFPASLRSEEGPVAGAERIAYSVNLSHFKAHPTEPSISPLLDKRVPGAGRLLDEWRLVKLNENVYELSGTVYNDNSYFPADGAAVLLGNIAVSDTLRLVAKTDAKGRFKVSLDNRTFAQYKREVEAEGYIVVRIDKGKPETQEMIYLKNRYLYIGDSDVDLYRYEIPTKRQNKTLQRRLRKPRRFAARIPKRLNVDVQLRRLMRILLTVINICGSALSALMLIVIIFGYETVAYVTGFPEVLPLIAIHSVSFIVSTWLLINRDAVTASLAFNSVTLILGALTSAMLMASSLDNGGYLLFVGITITNLLNTIVSKEKETPEKINKAAHPIN